MAEKLKSYGEFWPYYLAEHRRPGTRALHYVGTGVGLALLAAAAVAGSWWLLLAAVVSGYAFAWIGHAFVERNRPATFTYPVWSLISDFRMFFLALTGRLERERPRHGDRT
jgi:hypothetical protein